MYDDTQRYIQYRDLFLVLNEIKRTCIIKHNKNS